MRDNFCAGSNGKRPGSRNLTAGIKFSTDCFHKLKQKACRDGYFNLETNPTPYYCSSIYSFFLID